MVHFTYVLYLQCTELSKGDYSKLYEIRPIRLGEGRGAVTGGSRSFRRTLIAMETDNMMKEFLSHSSAAVRGIKSLSL